jgi:alkylation response protein AidB-like acyl-CoA dehydrogenase
MDFNDTPEEAVFRAEVRAWLEANAEPRDPSEREETLLTRRQDMEVLEQARAWQRRKADAGWACIAWPKEYGGRGVNYIQQVIWHQEEARFRVPPDVFAIGTALAGPTLLLHANEEQKRRYLPPMRRADEVWCQLFSEPAAGSDLAGVRTRAERHGDDWVVNGQKIWTSGAHYSDFGILLARTDPNAQKHAGLTYFIVDMKSAGIEVRPIRQISGGSHFNEVFFTDVRIPDANRVAAVGSGWTVALTTLMAERASLGSGTIGLASFDELLAFTRRTRIDTCSALQDSAVRNRLADFYIRSRGIELAGYRMLTALSNGSMPGPEASFAKLVAARLQQDMADFALELCGPAGAVASRDHEQEEQGVAKWQEAYLWTPALRIAGGTDEVMRNIVAERVLGLPPEIRTDKHIPFKDVPTGPG